MIDFFGFISYFPVITKFKNDERRFFYMKKLRDIVGAGVLVLASMVSGGCESGQGFTGKFNPGSVTFQKNAEGREDASAFALYGLVTGLQAK